MFAGGDGSVLRLEHYSDTVTLDSVRIRDMKGIVKLYKLGYKLCLNARFTESERRLRWMRTRKGQFRFIVDR